MPTIQSERSFWFVLWILGTVVGCGNELRDVRTIAGTVFNPMAAFGLYAQEDSITPEEYIEAATAPFANVCVRSPPGEHCHESGQRGTYAIEVPRASLEPDLLATDGGRGWYAPTIEPVAAPDGELDLTQHPIAVLRRDGVLSEAARFLGRTEVIAQGAGVLWAGEIVQPGGSVAFTRDIDFDVRGAVSHVWGIGFDAEDARWILSDHESEDPDATYPMAAMLYVGDGSQGHINVELSDPSPRFTLTFDPVAFPNEPGMVYFFASSTECVGEPRFRQPAQFVIERRFDDAVALEASGFSDSEFDVGVEAFDRTT